MLRPITCITLLHLAGAAALGPLGAQQLPAPSGPRALGRLTVHWTDSLRAEVLTSDPRDRREVLVTIWYPAVASDSLRAPYVDRLALLRPAFGDAFADLLAQVETHAVANARLDRRGAPYPVLLFAPGLGTQAFNYTAFAEELASHGYVVVAVDHPYDNGALALPDGRVIRQSPVWNQMAPGTVELDEAFGFRHERTAVWAEDVAFVLDRLHAGAPQLLGGALDLDRIGYYGHSLGGFAVAHACRLDPRIDACVNLDGWPIPGGGEEEGLEQPFLIVRDARPHRSDSVIASFGTTRAVYDANMAALDARTELMLERSPLGYLLTIDGMVHRAFGDAFVLRPASAPPALTLDPTRAVAIVNAYLLAFFDRHVRGREAPLLDEPTTAYPEVQLDVHRPGARARTTAPVPAAVRLEYQRAASAAIQRFRDTVAAHVEADGVGSIVAAVVIGERVIWSEAFGWHTAETATPATPAHLYRTGSISKSITALVMMRLVAQGAIALDDPVERYLPEIRNLIDYRADRPLTFRHLASHTGGLAREPGLEGAAEGPIDGWEDKILASIPTTAVETTPGARYSYSNIGYGILGLALSRAAGRPFMELTHDLVFTPLGMTTATFVVPPERRAQLATGYTTAGGVADTTLPAREHAGRGYKVPNGGVYASVFDLARFIGAVSGTRAEFLDEALRREMLRIQTPERQDRGYGLGLALTVDQHGNRQGGHGGSVAGYTAVTRFDPDRRIGVILLRNYNRGRTNLGRMAASLVAELAEALVP